MPDDRTPVKAAEWRWALIRSDLTAAQRHIALTLAVRMDPDGTIPRPYRVGVRRIAEDAGVHRNTVMPALRTLIEGGWLDETEPALGRRPAGYRATVPWHNHSAATPPDRRDEAAQPVDRNGHVVAQPAGRNGVDNGQNPVDEAVDSVGTSGVAAQLWHNDEPFVAQREPVCGTTTGPPPAVPAVPAEPSSSHARETPPPARPPADLDDLPRVDRLRYLRRAHDDLVDRGYADPPIDVIHQRAHELLADDPRQAQA